MFIAVKPNVTWSSIGLQILVLSIVMVIALSVADGIVTATALENRSPTIVLFATWVKDFRYLFEQGIYAATVFFVGAKFFETRTIFTVGFDKADSAQISLKGPDEDNIVWVGRRYRNRLEAEAIASALAERLKETA
jgi:hypothetical protein